MNGKRLYKYLKKSFFTGAIKNTIVACATIILLPLIIDQLGIERYGIVMMPMVFGGAVAFVDFGISKSVTYGLANSKSREERNSIVTSGLLLNLVIVLLLGFVVMLLVFLDIPVFGTGLDIQISLSHYILVTGFIILVISLLNNLLCSILEASLLQHYVNLGFALSSISLNVFLYLASQLFDSIEFVMMAPVAAFSLLAMYYLFVIMRKTDLKPGKYEYRQFFSLVINGIGFFQIGVVNSLVIPANKYLLVLLSASPGLLGLFDIALKIALISVSFLNSISQPLFAVFSNRQSSSRRISVYSFRIFCLLVVMLLSGLLAYYFLGLHISAYIDPANAEQLYKVSLILIGGLGVNACSEPFFKAILGAGALKQAMHLKLSVPIFNALLLLGLLSDDVLSSIAYSYAGALVLASLVMLAYFIKRFEAVRTGGS